jgi:hypothetical protein
MSAADAPAPAPEKYRDMFVFMNDVSERYYAGTGREVGPILNENVMYRKTAELLGVFAIADLRHDFLDLLDVEYEKGSTVALLLLSHIANGFYEVSSVENKNLFTTLVGSFKRMRNHASAVIAFEETMKNYFSDTYVDKYITEHFHDDAYAVGYFSRRPIHVDKDNMNLDVWTKKHQELDDEVLCEGSVALLVDAQNGRPAARLFLPVGYTDSDTYVHPPGSRAHSYIYNRTSINDAASKGASDAHKRMKLLLDDGPAEVEFSETDMMCASLTTLGKPEKVRDTWQIANNQLITVDDKLIVYGNIFSSQEKSSVNELAGFAIRGKGREAGAGAGSDIYDVLKEDPYLYISKLLCKSSGDRCQMHCLRAFFKHKIFNGDTPIARIMEERSAAVITTLSGYFPFLLTNDYLSAAQAYLGQINTIYSLMNRVEFYVNRKEREDLTGHLAACGDLFREYVGRKKTNPISLTSETIVPLNYAQVLLAGFWEGSRSLYLSEMLQTHPAYKMEENYTTCKRDIDSILRLFVQMTKEGITEIAKTNFFNQLDNFFQISKWSASVEKEINLIMEASQSIRGTKRTRATLYFALHSQISSLLQSNNLFNYPNAIAHHILLSSHPDMISLMKDKDYAKELASKILSLTSHSTLMSRLSSTEIQYLEKSGGKKIIDKIVALHYEYGRASLPGMSDVVDLTVIHPYVERCINEMKILDENFKHLEAILYSLVHEVGIILFYHNLFSIQTIDVAKFILVLSKYKFFEDLGMTTYNRDKNPTMHSHDAVIDTNDIKHGAISFQEILNEMDVESTPSMVETKAAELAKMLDKAPKKKSKMVADAKVLFAAASAAIAEPLKKATSDIFVTKKASKKALGKMKETFKDAVESVKTTATKALELLGGVSSLGQRRARGGGDGPTLVMPMPSFPAIQNYATDPQVKIKTQMETFLKTLELLQSQLIECMYIMNATMLGSLDINTYSYASRIIVLNRMIQVVSSPENLLQCLVLFVCLLSDSSDQCKAEWKMIWETMKLPEEEAFLKRYDDILLHDMAYTFFLEMMAFSGEWTNEERIETRDTCRNLLYDFLKSINITPPTSVKKGGGAWRFRKTRKPRKSKRATKRATKRSIGTHTRSRYIRTGTSSRSGRS